VKATARSIFKAHLNDALRRACLSYTKFFTSRRLAGSRSQRSKAPIDIVMRPLVEPHSPFPFTVVVAGLLLSGLAVGQAKSDKDLKDLMSLSLQRLEHIKVHTAARDLGDVGDAPSSVGLITAEQIQDHGWFAKGETRGHQ
jgi:hypothetical protein